MSGFTTAELSDIKTVNGGAAWGASTISDGDGSRQPSEVEFGIAEFQGKVSCPASSNLANQC